MFHLDFACSKPFGRVSVKVSMLHCSQLALRQPSVRSKHGSRPCGWSTCSDFSHKYRAFKASESIKKALSASRESVGRALAHWAIAKARTSKKHLQNHEKHRKTTQNLTKTKRFQPKSSRRASRTQQRSNTLRSANHQGSILALREALQELLRLLTSLKQLQNEPNQVINTSKLKISARCSNQKGRVLQGFGGKGRRGVPLFGPQLHGMADPSP